RERGRRRRVTYRCPRGPGSDRAECGGARDHLEQTFAAERQPVDRAQVIEKIGKISAILACHQKSPLFGYWRTAPGRAPSARPHPGEMHSSPAARRFSTTRSAYVNARGLAANTAEADRLV